MEQERNQAAIDDWFERADARREAQDNDLIDRFAAALKDKLAVARARGKDGWAQTDWRRSCQQQLIDHLAKGDPRDVANYCAFLWHHGWPTVAPTPPDAAARGDGGRVKELERLVAEGAERYAKGQISLHYQPARDWMRAMQDAANRAPTTTPAPGSTQLDRYQEWQAQRDMDRAFNERRAEMQAESTTPAHGTAEGGAE